MKRYFIEKDIQMAIKCMKICSTSLAIREYKLKPQWDITIRMTKLKIVIPPNASEDAETLDQSFIAGRNAKSTATLLRQVSDFL